MHESKKSVVELTPDILDHLLDTIIVQHAEPHRFYHTIKHVEHMLDKIYELSQIHLVGTTLLKLAAFYHDIYYQPTNIHPRLTNEFFSAAIARRELSECINSYSIEVVEQLILLTQKHKTNNELRLPIILQEIFLDADMSILGETPEIYQKYSENIEREYTKDFLSITYYVKRKEFLSNLLGNKHIFYTRYMQQVYSNQAIKNIQDENLRLAVKIKEHDNEYIQK